MNFCATELRLKCDEVCKPEKTLASNENIMDEFCIAKQSPDMEGRTELADRTPLNVRDRMRTFMYTPRTPLPRQDTLRRSRTRLSASSSETGCEVDDALEGLIKRPWSIWGVSPLFGFEYNEVKLKQYAKRLREELGSLLAQENVQYKVNFKTIENLAAGRNPAIDVIIHKNSMDNTVTSKCIYQGIFLSWHSDMEEDDNQECIKLPVLLCRGYQNAIKVAHDSLFRMFDCTVTALTINQKDLMWLTSINLIPGGREGTSQAKDGELQLEYHVPGLPATDKIKVIFPISKMKMILADIRQDDSSETDNVITLEAEHVEEFFEIIKAQMLHTASLQLGLCVLQRINLPTLTIAGNKMRVMNIEAMDRTLKYLQDKSYSLIYSQRHDSTS